jgi:hypothetical protein
MLYGGMIQIYYSSTPTTNYVFVHWRILFPGLKKKFKWEETQKPKHGFGDKSAYKLLDYELF